MLSEELKGCPFCGGKALLGRLVSPIFKKIDKPNRVFCERCKCMTPPTVTEQEAIEKWNTREGDK